MNTTISLFLQLSRPVIKTRYVEEMVAGLPR
jgi:hypothetical protein